MNFIVKIVIEEHKKIINKVNYGIVYANLKSI